MTNSFITARSEGGLFPHKHTLEISRDAIKSAPADGLLLTTSTEYSLIFKHNHQVHLSQGDLKSLSAGQTVVVFDTDKGRHSFRICLEE